jgi:DNA-binding transcriptional regulator YiaG
MRIDLSEAAPILEAASKEQKAAETISEFRQGLGLNKADFARLCNCSFQSVFNWESGLRRPGGTTVRLLQALDFISRSGLMPEFRKKVL